MSNLTLVEQGELFPQDSPFHSKHNLKTRLAERAAVAPLLHKGGGRPAGVSIGERYGILTIVEALEERHNGDRVYLCRCDCGQEIRARSGSFKRKGHPLTHCGCQGIHRNRVSRPGSLGINGYAGGIRVQENNPQRAFAALLSSYRRGAAVRGYTWELSDQEFLDLSQGNCAYCGSEPKQIRYALGKRHSFVHNGVDRVDNERPYTADNCVPCCEVCNRAKREQSRDEFVAWVGRVYEHLYGRK